MRTLISLFSVYLVFVAIAACGLDHVGVVAAAAADDARSRQPTQTPTKKFILVQVNGRKAHIY